MYEVMQKTTTGGREKEPVGGAMKIVFLTLRKHKHMNLEKMITEVVMDHFMYLEEVVEILFTMLGYLQGSKQDILSQKI